MASYILAYLLTRLRIPNRYCLISTSTGNIFPILRVNSTGNLSCMPNQMFDNLIFFCIPNFCTIIITWGEYLCAVRWIGHLSNVAIMSFNFFLDKLACRWIYNSNLFISWSRYNSCSIRRKWDCLHNSINFKSFANLLSGLKIPYSESSISTRWSNFRAIWRKGNTGNKICVPFKRLAYLFSSFWIPYNNSFIKTCWCYFFAIFGKSNTLNTTSMCFKRKHFSKFYFL